MIRVDHTRAKVPQRLGSDGPQEVARLRRLRETRPLMSHDFDGWYGDPEIKEALWQMQHEKCCYCEREYEPKHSHVDHYRPKARAIRADGTADEGYWWLAYRFENLYFSCRICNEYKHDHFPLDPGSTPLVPETAPWSDPHDERPLLLDPGQGDIEAHLTYEKLPSGEYQIAPIDGSPSGRETIDRLKLDRDDLTRLRNKYRRKHIKPVLLRYQEAVAEGNDGARIDALRDARRLIADDAQYALLARVVFRAAFVPLWDATE